MFIHYQKCRIHPPYSWTSWGRGCKKHNMFGPLLDVQMLFRVAGARDSAPCQKWAKREGFLAFPKTGRGGTFEEDLERCIFCGRCNTRDTRNIFIRDVRRSGRWFLERGCIWNIRSSVLGRWFCVTGAALCMTWHHFFVAGAILQRHGLENCKTHWHEAVSSALNFPLSWKKSRRTASFFDDANFKNWGSLAELLRFWCCELQKLRKSRRIASFLTLSSARVGEASQKCIVFKLADR